MSTGGTLFANHAWLKEGWALNVRLHWNDAGDITQIECDAKAHSHEIQEQFVVPGMVNLHSHAFQRAMAGMTEIDSGSDSFWTWRDLMYRFALAINPEQMEAIAAQVYSECLRHGYTSVCEFHYLHRAPEGDFYDNMAETASRVIAAARETGIGMTMLPVLYSYSDFNQQALRHEQRRFATNPDQVLQLISLLETQRDGQVEIGAAPHSLRAASISQIDELIQSLPSSRPVHIHIAEQRLEVETCLAHSGKRPVDLLMETLEVDARWCLVHATHLSAGEVERLARSQAVVGICPSTEGNLGDGFFELPSYISKNGRFGIGSDSHVSQSPVEELRWLEYAQRLRAQRRNIASVPAQSHIGDYLWQASLHGGAQASGRAVGQLAPGMRADMLVLDANHPNLNGIKSADVFNTWLFSGNDNLVRDVLAGGQWRVKNGQHSHQASIETRFRRAMHELRYRY